MVLRQNLISGQRKQIHDLLVASAGCTKQRGLAHPIPICQRTSSQQLSNDLDMTSRGCKVQRSVSVARTVVRLHHRRLVGRHLFARANCIDQGRIVYEQLRHDLVMSSLSCEVKAVRPSSSLASLD